MVRGGRTFRADYFPQDILRYVLLRLPVKTLVVCCCVCKLWRDIITNPFFVAKYSSKSHLHRHLHQLKKPLFLEYLKYENICRVFSSDKKPVDGKELFHSVYGWCKGLALLSVHSSDPRENKMLFIVNPSLHRFIPLPFDGSHDHRRRCGIGFDSVSNDYKVLSFNLQPCQLQISLYSLNTNSWKDITAKAQYPLNMYHLPYNLVFLNGYLHWMTYICNSKDDRRITSYLILRFDVTREIFDIMCLPEMDGFCCSVAIVFGKICFGRSRSNICSIWLMNEYDVKESWTMQLQVDELVLGGKIDKILGSRGDDELLFDCFGEVISYDCKSNKVNHSFVHPSYNRRSLYMENLEESLVLFDRRVSTQ